MAKKLTEFKNEQTPAVDWKEEKILEGLYVGSKVVTTVNGESKIYTVEKKGGDEVGVWGTTMLDNFFRNITEGTEIRIEYLGKEDGKAGRQYHNFKMEYDKDTMPQKGADIDKAFEEGLK